jgi:hypothetical protein
MAACERKHAISNKTTHTNVNKHMPLAAYAAETRLWLLTVAHATASPGRSDKIFSVLAKSLSFFQGV